MEMDDENLTGLIASVGDANSTAEALAAYLFAEPRLRNYKFVLASRSGAETGFSANKDFSGGAAVRSLFKTDKVVVLDSLTVGEMLTTPTQRIKYPIDYSISLDTQAVSHLEPYVTGRDPMKVDRDLQEVFRFIARDDVFVDPIPYIAENLDNLAIGSATNKIFSKIKAYEVLRTLDVDRLMETGEAHSVLSEAELTKRAQKFISRMLYEKEDSAMMTHLRFSHQFAYAHLLKMVWIHFRWPQASMEENMERFAEFSDSTLAVMGGREIALARAYFERGQSMMFFRKVQKKKTDLLEILRNMAWDLCHIRRMELALTLEPDPRARYFFPALLTFDKGLIEVIDLHPLKACAYKVGSAEPMPFFDGDWFDFVAETPESKASFRSRYYSEQAIFSRKIRRSAVRDSFGEIVAEMEKDIKVAAEI